MVEPILDFERQVLPMGILVVDIDEHLWHYYCRHY